MTKSKLVGLDMPKDFPTGLQERVHERIIDSGRLATDAKSQFLGASSGLIYRFVQCAEHDEAFTASICESDAPPQPERYWQERDLFGFFVSGLSALECLSFGLFAVGSALDSGSFPFRGPQDYGNVTPEKTARSFGRSFSGGQISTLSIRLCPARITRSGKPSATSSFIERPREERYTREVDPPLPPNRERTQHRGSTGFACISTRQTPVADGFRRKSGPSSRLPRSFPLLTSGSAPPSPGD